MLSFNGMAMRPRLRQRMNAPSPIVSSLSLNSKSPNPVQSRNAPRPIVLTDDILIFRREGQRKNANDPIVSSLSPNSTFHRSVQSLNASFPTSLTLGNPTFFKSTFLLMIGNLILLRDQHPSNACGSIFSIPSCVSTDNKFVRFRNAPLGIILTDRSMRT